MDLAFEHVWALATGLLSVPIAWMAWRSLPILGASRAWVGVSLRLAVLLLLCVALAQPSVARTSNDVALLVVTDTSASIPLDLMQKAEDEVDRAIVATAKPGDRVGLIGVARSAHVEAAPQPIRKLPALSTLGQRDASNLASGLRMALAMKPADSSARILLVSDGNQTEGSVEEAAELARAAGVPIDVLAIAYEHSAEVLVEAVHAPARARDGQSIDLRVTLRSQGAGSGRLKVWQDDELLFVGDESGLHVDLEPGPNIVRIPVVPGGTGAHRYRVAYEPDNAGQDGIPENNVGAATVLVSGTGRVLLIEREGSTEGDVFERIMAFAGIECARTTAERVCAGGLAALVAYDAIVLADVPRWELTNACDQQLLSYVADLGGGLIVLGGPNSFGAGGWQGSRLAEAMPVLLEPPQTRELLRTGLVIVLDNSGSMLGGVGSGGLNKQSVAADGAIAAVQALSRLDEVSIIVFNGQTEVVVPMAPRGDAKALAARIRDIGTGGGTIMLPALQAARAELQRSRAGAKHVIVLTDGVSADPPEDLLAQAAQMRRDGSTMSTIVIGDDANLALLMKLAAAGGGQAHFVRLDRAGSELPQVFVREAVTRGRALIVEGDFAVAAQGGTSGPGAGVGSAPSIRGYVLSAPREGLAQIPLRVRNDEGSDPLLAYWNHGVGRAVAFTSDLSGRWTGQWESWADLQQFWEQTTRWVMRPAMPEWVSVATRLDGETVTLEAIVRDSNRGWPAGIQTAATIVRPDGSLEHLPLRQNAPGTFVGEFQASRAGAYLADVAVTAVHQQGEALDARSGRVQAVVSVPYPREYRATRTDDAVLRQIAAKSGGRFLNGMPVEAWDLFDRTGLSFSQARKPFWDLAVIVAAVLLLCDIAVRRLAAGIFWRQEEVTRHAAVPAESDALDEGDEVDSLANLRRARDRAGHRTGQF